MGKPLDPVYQLFLEPGNNDFDPNAFDSFIVSKGVALDHYIGLPCPLGLSEPHDSRTHSDHHTCSNGFIYRKKGVFTGALLSNSITLNLGERGIGDASSATLILPSTYDDGTKLHVSQRDRIYLKDCVLFTDASEIFEAHQSGTDRLQFPVLQVEMLIDANGKEYFVNQNFIIEQGLIKWISSERPGYDPKISKGVVCSVRYRYQPFWYVERFIHEIRVIKHVNDFTGEHEVIRAPQAVMLEREFVHRNQRRDDNDAFNSSRTVKSPPSGGWGSR